MPTNINFNKKLGFINGTSIVLPSGPAADFSTKSLSFDGVDDYVSTQEVYSELDGQNKMTLSLWMKPISGGLLYEYVVTVPRNSTANEHVFSFQHFENNYLSFSIDGRTTKGVLGNISAITYGQWNHILCCLDGTLSGADRMRIYINGVDESYNANIGTFTALQNASGGLMIGKEPQDAYNPYKGLLDEVAIWSGVDLRNDVATIYNNGKPADLTSLNPTSWYRAGENSTFAYPQILMPENTNKDKVSKYSLAFDGLDDYISIGTNSLGITDSITVSAWVKIPTTNTGGGGTNIQVIACEDTTSGGRRNWSMFWRGTGSNYFAWVIHHTNLTSSSVTTTGITPNDGQWHHILGTYDGTTNANGIKLYVDGVLNVQGTAGSTGINAFASSEPAIGALTGGISWRLEGNIDEVAVWSDDLSASVNAIYNGGVPNDIASLYPTRLEGYWKLGEEAKFTNNWLVPNSALSNFSKYSFNFDGIDDYVSIPTITLPTDFSVSMWVKATTSGSVRDQVFGGASGFFVFGTVVLNGGADANKMTYYNGSSYVALTPAIIRDGNWHNIVITYNSSATNLIAYTDGVETYNATYDAGTNNVIDRISEDTYGNYWKGNLDELAVWDSELSAGAVTAIYNGGKPKDLSGFSPVSWWRMGEEATYDGGTNQFTIPDQGSGGNTGTSSNTMLLETLVGDAPQYYGGGISDSMDIFDRVGDAPNSENNTVSFNMEEADIVEDTP